MALIRPRPTDGIGFALVSSKSSKSIKSSSHHFDFVTTTSWRILLHFALLAGSTFFTTAAPVGSHRTTSSSESSSATSSGSTSDAATAAQSAAIPLGAARIRRRNVVVQVSSEKFQHDHGGLHENGASWGSFERNLTRHVQVGADSLKCSLFTLGRATRPASSSSSTGSSEEAAAPLEPAIAGTETTPSTPTAVENIGGVHPRVSSSTTSATVVPGVPPAAAPAGADGDVTTDEEEDLTFDGYEYDLPTLRDLLFTRVGQFQRPPPRLQLAHPGAARRPQCWEVEKAGDTYWGYQLCLGERIRQFQRSDPSSGYSLGTLSSQLVAAFVDEVDTELYSTAVEDEDLNSDGEDEDEQPPNDEQGGQNLDDVDHGAEEEDRADEAAALAAAAAARRRETEARDRVWRFGFTLDAVFSAAEWRRRAALYGKNESMGEAENWSFTSFYDDAKAGANDVKTMQINQVVEPTTRPGRAGPRKASGRSGGRGDRREDQAPEDEKGAGLPPALEHISSRQRAVLGRGLRKGSAELVLFQYYKGGTDGRKTAVRISCGEHAPSLSKVSEPRPLEYVVDVSSPALCSQRDLEAFGMMKYVSTFSGSSSSSSPGAPPGAEDKDKKSAKRKAKAKRTSSSRTESRGRTTTTGDLHGDEERVIENVITSDNGFFQTSAVSEVRVLERALRRSDERKALQRWIDQHERNEDQKADDDYDDDVDEHDPQESGGGTASSASGGGRKILKSAAAAARGLWRKAVRKIVRPAVLWVRELRIWPWNWGGGGRGSKAKPVPESKNLLDSLLRIANAWHSRATSLWAGVGGLLTGRTFFPFSSSSAGGPPDNSVGAKNSTKQGPRRAPAADRVREASTPTTRSRASTTSGVMTDTSDWPRRPHVRLLKESVPLDALLGKYFGQCVNQSEGWWAYEYCFPHGLRQFHTAGEQSNEIETAFSLGFSESALGKLLNLRTGIVSDWAREAQHLLHRRPQDHAEQLRRAGGRNSTKPAGAGAGGNYPSRRSPVWPLKRMQTREWLKDSRLVLAGEYNATGWYDFGEAPLVGGSLRRAAHRGEMRELERAFELTHLDKAVPPPAEIPLWTPGGREKLKQFRRETALKIYGENMLQVPALVPQPGAPPAPPRVAKNASIAPAPAGVADGPGRVQAPPGAAARTAERMRKALRGVGPRFARSVEYADFFSPVGEPACWKSAEFYQVFHDGPEDVEAGKHKQGEAAAPGDPGGAEGEGTEKFLVRPTTPRLDISPVVDLIRPRHVPELKIVPFPKMLFQTLAKSDEESHPFLAKWERIPRLHAVWQRLVGGTRCEETGAERATEVFFLCPPPIFSDERQDASSQRDMIGGRGSSGTSSRFGLGARAAGGPTRGGRGVFGRTAGARPDVGRGGARGRGTHREQMNGNLDGDYEDEDHDLAALFAGGKVEGGRPRKQRLGVDDENSSSSHRNNAKSNGSARRTTATATSTSTHLESIFRSSESETDDVESDEEDGEVEDPDHDQEEYIEYFGEEEMRSAASRSTPVAVTLDREGRFSASTRAQDRDDPEAMPRLLQKEKGLLYFATGGGQQQAARALRPLPDTRSMKISAVNHDQYSATFSDHQVEVRNATDAAAAGVADSAEGGGALGRSHHGREEGGEVAEAARLSTPGNVIYTALLEQSARFIPSASAKGPETAADGERVGAGRRTRRGGSSSSTGTRTDDKDIKWPSEPSWDEESLLRQRVKRLERRYQHMIHDEMHVVAIAETLCQYRLVISAPAVCAHPQLNTVRPVQSSRRRRPEKKDEGDVFSGHQTETKKHVEVVRCGATQR